MNANPPAAPAPSPIVGAVNAAVNAATGAFNSKNSNSKNSFSFNSLIPFGMANNKPANNSRNSKANGAENAPINNMFTGNNKPANNAVGVQEAPPTFKNFSVPSYVGAAAVPFGIFLTLIVVFLVVFSFFNTQIKQGYEYMSQAFKKSMGINNAPPVRSEIIPIHGDVTGTLPPLPTAVTVPPVAPQTVTPSQEAATARHSIVERILPSGSNEVYNVAQNKFTYYDAEPLCRALGAELATYEQVKEAWGKGADWCNYGWVKGQMAVYPTQRDTYDKLQSGPEEERNACGTAGINGGFFDNPEILYGVNCYGKKPDESAHDERMLMEKGKVPHSPEFLKVDQKTREFKDDVDSLYVKPFSDDKWSSA